MQETPFKPQINLDEVGPEVRAYIYQIIMEFEPFTTPQTVVSVVAKDPVEKSRTGTMYRIAITLAEDGTQISEEASDENLLEAIRKAKEKMLLVLNEIQDSVISASDRQSQIQTALQGTQLH